MVGFIDVPGHERFVHTAVTAARGIDLFFAVTADDEL